MYHSVFYLCALLLLLQFSNVNGQLTSWNWESNTAATRVGAHVAKCDINNDSYLDLITTGTTSVYIFYGTASGAFSSTPSAVRSIFPGVTTVTDGLGLDCADLNADGFADVLVGNWTGNPAYIHIFNGSASGVAATSTNLPWSGAGTYFGAALTTGDFNGDGKKDLAVGAYGSGRVLIFWGLGASGVNPTYSSTALLYPVVLTYGQTMASCDLSNDGKSNLIVGARSMNSSRGQVFIYSYSGSTWSLSHNSSGAAASAFYGFDAACGDVNGDGNNDVVILSQGDRLLYVYYGTGNVLTLPKTPSLVIPAIDAARSISVSDQNLDGYADIIVGFNAVSKVGVWYGGPALTASSSASLTYTGPTGSGWSVVGLGNIDGAGLGDVAFGSFAYTNGQTSEGLVGVWYPAGAAAPSASVTPSPSSIPSASASSTPSSSSVPSASSSVTPSSSSVPTSSVTPSSSSIPSASSSVTPSSSSAPTSSVTPSTSSAASASPTSSTTPSSSVTPSTSSAPSASVTPSASPSISASSSPSSSVSPSSSPSISRSPSPAVVSTAPLTSWTWESNIAATRVGGRLGRCDINNDSYLDLIATGTLGVYVFLGNSSGAFGSVPSVTIPIMAVATITTDALGIECADLNADGFADVIVGNWTGNPAYVHIYNGTATGIASTPVTLSWTGAGTYFGAAMTTGDFNGDGKKDLAVGAYGAGRVVIYWGLGAAGLNPTGSSPAILYPVVLTYGLTMAACDLSNDGTTDMIVGARSMNSSRGQVFIYSYSGSSWSLSHNSSGAAASSFYGYEAGCADVNGDGNKDVVILSQGDRFVYVYYGTGNVLTLPKTPSLVIPVIDASRAMSVSDQNLDGYADIVVGFNAVSKVGVWYGGPTLSSSSSASLMYSCPSGAGWAVSGLGNIDGVGQGEIAYGSFAYTNGQSSEGLVGVWYNPSPSAAPSVTPSISVSPSSSSSPSATPTSTATPTASITPTASVTATPTTSATATASPTTSATATPTTSATATASATPSGSAVPSASPSRAAVSASRTPSRTPSPAASSSPSSSTVPSASSSPLAFSPMPEAICAQCNTDADCSNGLGICVTSSIGRYCSCLSGFGGCDCSLTPSTQCSGSYSAVDPLQANFQANATVDYQYPDLFVSVEANLEESAWGNGGSDPANPPPYSLETIIYFGSSPTAYPECSYPNGEATWKDLPAGASCSDVYQAGMSWSYAKDNCGFSAPIGSRNYSQTVTILRRYNLNGVLTRTEKTTRHLYVNFPSEIEVDNSGVSVSFPAANAFAALTSIDYSPDTLLWTVTVLTSVNSPYSLTAPVAALYSGNLEQRAPTVSVSGCNTVGSACVQTITYTYPQGGASDPCFGLFGIDLHTFALQCSTAACPAPNLLNVTLSLNTGNACPVTDDIDFSEASLHSYSNAGLSNAKDSFSVIDVVYFGASVQSTEALISSRALKAGSVCFLPPSGTCFYPEYTILSSSNGKDPVFSVDFTAPGNAAYFGSITTPTAFDIKATVVVNFAGANKSMKKAAHSAPHAQTVETVAKAIIGGQANSSNIASPFLMLVLVLLAATLNM